MPSYIKTLLVNGARVENAESLAEQVGETPDWLGGINRVTLPAGPDPGFGKFLIHRPDYDTKWPESTPFDIEIERMPDDDDPEPETLTLKGYVTVSAHAALRRPDSPMIVTVADIRYLFAEAITNRNWNAVSWQHFATGVIAALKEDLPLPGYDTLLSLGSFYHAVGAKLRFEGMRTLDVLAEVGSRNRQFLTYNPKFPSLDFIKIKGTQSGLSETLASAKLYRPYELVDTGHAEGIGKVTVLFYFIDTDLSATSISRDNPANPTGRGEVAWGVYLAGSPQYNEQQIREIEADWLSNAWFDWSERRISRRVDEYIGVLDVLPGEEVSAVSWYVSNGELFTSIDRGAPPPPRTLPQRRVSDSTAFFQTGVSGIPAAISATQPSQGVCTKLLFNRGLGTFVTAPIVALPDDSSVFNSCMGAIKGTIVIQAKRINGAWFADVVDCNQ